MTNRLLRYLAILTITAHCYFASAAEFVDYLRPAVKNGGFSMNGYCIWCSSIVKVGDTFHMFASRWPAQYGLAGWTTYSECVRATSKNLFGPYVFQEVVLQKRPGHWDSARVHNVKIVRAGGKFVLYYIATSNSTGYAVADSVTGPWQRCDHMAMNFSNPAPLVRPDQSIYCFGRKKDSRSVDIALAFRAPTYSGPYKLFGDGQNLLPNDYELEDPTIWWADNRYNVLVTDIGGRATGIGKAGVEYFSTDGLHYQRSGKEIVFGKTVNFDDGTSETFARRERPFVYVNDRNEVIALFTACLPRNGPSRVVVQPVERYVP
jgi:hypothetical protein